MTDAPKPNSSLVVVDLAAGMAPALVAKFLIESGAKVAKLEPAPGDPFYSVYPAYEVWHRGADIRKHDGAPETLKALLAKADVCIIGGEDFPGLDRPYDAAALSREYPRLVVVDIAGYPKTLENPDRPATDILVQARSGLSYEHYSQRPLLMSFEPSQYGAAFQALAGLYAALYERERSGNGQIVLTSLYQGTLTWVAMVWCEASKPTPGFSFVMPLDPWPTVFRCSDGRYLHIILGSTGSKGRLYQILGINDPNVSIDDSGLPSPNSAPKNFFGDIDLLASYFKDRESGEILEKMWAARMAAESVNAPGECWDDPQVEHNRIIVRDADGTRHVGNPVYSASSPAVFRTPPPAGKKPLEGITVVDFGLFAAGPYSSVVLGDLGANVIKVESPAGDPNRGVFRAFSSCNRGKRSIALDMKTPEGRDMAFKLCTSADIVTNNFRTGVSARLGIDAKSLQRAKPELIVLESAAYGPSGPKCERAGFDMAFQAFCGHEYRAGGKGNPPLWNRTSMVDYAGGMLGAIAILRALYERSLTGNGAELSVALMNAGISILSELVQKPDGTFAGAREMNHEQTGYHPAEQMYESTDGWIAVSARNEAMANVFARTLGLTDLAAKPRALWFEKDAAEIAKAIKTRSVADILAALEKAHVWAEACRQGAAHATLNDPRLIEAATVHVSEHPQLGEIREIGALVGFSRSLCSGTGHTPLKGEHTNEILRAMGYDDDAIQSLRNRNVVA
jgi:crotonobetainyl-CoA:carnitine CoA-transferase CaiB-like acyl-CoA transferase